MRRMTAAPRRKMMKLHLRPLAGVGFLLAAAVLVVACGGNSNEGSTSGLSTTWGLPGADLQNSRYVGGPINSSNVSTLGVAWTVPITASGAFGGYATTPVVADDVLYTQDLESNVQAIDLETGKVLWTKKYNSSSVGPNGVTVSDGTVYGATNDSVFALQADNGQQLWIKKLTRNTNEGIDMAPGINNGTVYVSTVPGNAKRFYAGDGQAVLTAMDAATGAVKWTWDEVPDNLWSNKHKNINSGGGQWYPPTFDDQGNLYIGVSNPAPFTGTPKFPWGSSRPGPNLYTDSIVKLDASTGKLDWYYQLTPHDIYDWDMENAPVLATVNGKQVVIDGGKAGILVEVDAQTGKLIWKRPVGDHNGHDNDNLAAEKGDFSNLKIPVTILPGDLGGIESQLATNGKTVFAAVNNLATTYKGQGLEFASDAAARQGHRRLRGGRRGDGEDQVGREDEVLALRRRDDRQRRRVHDDVRRHAPWLRRQHGQGGLQHEAPGRHQRAGRRGRRHADHRGQLPERPRPEGDDRRVPPGSYGRAPGLGVVFVDDGYDDHAQ